MRLLLATLLFALAGCGVDYCFMGLGDCAKVFANIPDFTVTPTPTPTATPTLTPTP